uniref:Polymer-forming cytoskeletal protein n=1 Tax=uncultured prokaryote TaxID=198431 RepID=H5SKU7_9ZZZZ|nr:hypothetical protein HGMM_F42G09C09 [uncultured prokaryote]
MIATLFLTAAVHAVAPAGAVVVQGEVPQVLVVAGDVRVEGRVAGNVVVVLGDVVFGSGGRVDGDLVVLGGSVQGAGEVRGRSWVVGGQPPAGSTPLGWALVRLGLWLLVSFLLLAGLPRAVRHGAEVLAAKPLASLAAGLGFLLLWLSVAVFVGVTVSGPFALVLWAVLAAFLLGFKIFGVVGLAWVVGRRLRLWLPVGLRGEIPRTGLAVAGLVLLSLMPLVGTPFWLVANVVGVGGTWLGFAVRWPLVQAARGKAASSS